ncbi:hypothetical protein XPA_010085 [Xanthoria parietina]
MNSALSTFSFGCRCLFFIITVPQRLGGPGLLMFHPDSYQRVWNPLKPLFELVVISRRPATTERCTNKSEAAARHIGTGKLNDIRIIQVQLKIVSDHWSNIAVVLVL